MRTEQQIDLRETKAVSLTMRERSPIKQVPFYVEWLWRHKIEINLSRHYLIFGTPLYPLHFPTLLYNKVSKLI